MLYFPPAKINLGLSIIEKQDDGYHRIETIVYPVPWYDILEILPAQSFSLKSLGLSIQCSTEDNLIFKAINLMKGYGFLAENNFKICLYKSIPVGAGLGGGSSDATNTIMALNRQFNLKLQPTQIHQLASEIGSDCPFFIRNQPVLASGTGNKLKEVSVNLKNKFLVIVYPNISVSTTESYQQIQPSRQKTSLEKIISLPLKDWKDNLINDFEESLIQKHPVIGEIKAKLYRHGALYTSMSGSGSAVYGIFDTFTELKHLFPNFTYWSGFLN